MLPDGCVFLVRDLLENCNAFRRCDGCDGCFGGFVDVRVQWRCKRERRYNAEHRCRRRRLAPSLPFRRLRCKMGAVMVSLGFTTPGSLIYYTVDGSTPNDEFELDCAAPFLVASNLTIKAIWRGAACSNVTSHDITLNIPSGDTGLVGRVLKFQRHECATRTRRYGSI